MTRRARARAVCSLSGRGTFELGLKPGDAVRVSTRRGEVEDASRQDDAIPDGVVFVPFCFVEAAANLLTNPALDPFGKIPEFKYRAVRTSRRRRGSRRRSNPSPEVAAECRRATAHAVAVILRGSLRSHLEDDG